MHCGYFIWWLWTLDSRRVLYTFFKNTALNLFIAENFKRFKMLRKAVDRGLQKPCSVDRALVRHLTH